MNKLNQVLVSQTLRKADAIHTWLYCFRDLLTVTDTENQRPYPLMDISLNMSPSFYNLL